MKVFARTTGHETFDHVTKQFAKLLKQSCPQHQLKLKYSNIKAFLVSRREEECRSSKRQTFQKDGRLSRKIQVVVSVIRNISFVAI